SGNDLSEESVDASGNDLSEESVDVSANDLSEEEEDIFSNSVSGNEIKDSKDNIMEQEWKTLITKIEEREYFPGLEDYHLLSQEELEEKEILEAYLPEVLSLEEGVDYASNEIIVGAKDEQEAESYAQAFGGTLKEFIGGKESFAVITLNEADIPGEEKVSVSEAVLASLSEELCLPPAWPNYYYQLLEEELSSITEQQEEAEDSQKASDLNLACHYNDPFLQETDSNYQWHHEVIGSSVAWAYGYTGKGIKVAVLDTGIKTGHQDISTRPIEVNSSIGIEDNYSNAHGTHVAALIGAKGNNGLGGVGIAPDCEVLTLKVFGDGAVDTLMAAIQLAIENEADIINMSLGSALYSLPFEEKVKEAYQEGIAVFGAAGNDGHNSMFYPGVFEGSTAVGALDKSNQKAKFSNYNSAVRYVAPGVDIPSASNGSSAAYRKLSGTSQAAPIVSGIAAVLLSSGKVQGEGTKRVDNLLALMDKGCIKVTGTGLGKGYISLVKALGLDTLIGPPTAPQISLESGIYKEASKEVTLIPSPGSTVYYTLDGKNISLKDGIISEGAIKYTSGEVIKIEGKARVILKARAVSNGNGTVSKQVQASYDLKPAASKVTIASKTGGNQVAAGKSLQLQVSLMPSYTTDKSVKWLVEEGVSGITADSGKITVKNNVEPGEYRITAIAKDSNGKYQGASDTYIIQVIRQDNPITRVKFPVKTITVPVGEEVGIPVEVYYKDNSLAQSNQLNWRAEKEGILHVREEEGRLFLQGIKKGKSKVIGTATDGHGKQFLLAVTVNQQVEQIEITGYATLAVGKSITLKSKVIPEDANNKAVAWSVLEGENLVFRGISVSSSGKVTASSKVSEQLTGENQTGLCVIQARARDGSGVVATYTLTITKDKMKSLKPEQTKVQLFRLENKYQSATTQKIEVETTGGNPQAWQAESNKPGLVTVEKEESGFLVKATGKGTGTAVITLKSTDGTNLKKTCKVTVSNPPGQLKVAAQGGRSSYLAKGKKLRLIPVLEATYGKIDSYSRKLQWTSSNPEAVAVDQKGNAIALTEDNGIAYITVSTTDGSNLSATYRIITCSETKKISLKGYSDTRSYISLGKAIAMDVVYENTDTGSFNPSKEIVVERNKAGLEPYFYTDSNTGKKRLALCGNKKGTYKVTISMKDGSKAKKTYTFKVE
ncbi:MAG: S8 family serine peptidase, partial [Lachnospiraceae bacterium]|nr:S8 family serine peptidase [Lachnospiraceae bacterium]